MFTQKQFVFQLISQNFITYYFLQKIFNTVFELCKDFTELLVVMCVYFYYNLLLLRRTYLDYIILLNLY